MIVKASKDWIEDCMYWHGRVLEGEKAHWCPDFDELPIDETCAEIELCICFTDPKIRPVA